MGEERREIPDEITGEMAALSLRIAPATHPIPNSPIDIFLGAPFLVCITMESRMPCETQQKEPILMGIDIPVKLSASIWRWWVIAAYDFMGFPRW